MVASLFGFDTPIIQANVITSIAALRAVNSVQMAYAVVQGYYAIGDGGGGSYYFDPSDTTSADNGGTVIVASDNARWKLIHYNSVSVKQFGVVGDGVIDDTALLQTALNSYSDLIVPLACTPLVTNIAVPVCAKLSFLGGNNTGTVPSSYLVKKSTAVGAGITLAASARIEGGALICQAGNTGDGVQCIGNGVKISNFLVKGAGGNGVRVGMDISANTNSCDLEHVISIGNGGHGFEVHDGFLSGGSNANAGKLTQCFATGNGGDGYHIGHAFWVHLDTCLSEVNTGWGLMLSGIANATYPECRWTTVTGGDYNEGNGAGQISDAAYCSTFIQPDNNNIPSTVANGLQGSALRTIVSSLGGSYTVGLRIYANHEQDPLMLDDSGVLAAGDVTYPLHTKKITAGGNGQGVGHAFYLDPNTGNTVVAGSIKVIQNTSNVYGWIWAGYKAGAPLDLLALNANNNTLAVVTDLGLSLGVASNRWSQTFTGNLVLSTVAVSGGAGTVVIGGTVATTVGAAGGASALPATPLGYVIANVAGTQVKIPYYNN